MINLQQSTEGMAELLYGGKQADLIFALRIASLSANQSLEANGRLARYIAQFTGRLLPEREELYAGLSACRARVLSSHISALRSIDLAWQSELLAPYETLPAGYDAQVAWRAGLVELIFGMAEKTVSFAALILDPMRCDLCPIDRWHMKRLGLPIQSLRTARYLAVERQLKIEKDDSGYAACPLGLWSAWQWGIIRDGDSAYQDGITSHKSLSCRWY